MSGSQFRGKKKVLVKIIIIGESGVGKTALLHKYVMGKFIEDHKATIGADFLSKEITVDDKIVTLQIWDTAGQERFQSLGNAFYRGSDACILVYDITDQNSFNQIEQWRNKFINQADITDEREYPFLLLGNKSDINERAVNLQEGTRYAQSKNMVFFETSAMNGTNVDMGIRKIAEIASEMDTVPIFSPGLLKMIDTDNDYTPPATQGGCCSLL